MPRVWKAIKATARFLFSLLPSQGHSSWFKRQVGHVIEIIILAWIVTALAAYFGLWPKLTGEFTDETVREVFAAWTGELLFFTVIGALLAIVSFRAPEEENFLQRLIMLYRGLNVPEPVLHYNSRYIQKLSGFATRAHRTVFVEEYDETIGAYPVVVETEYEIKNMLPDVEYDDRLRIRISPDKFANPPADLGHVISLQVGVEEHITRHSPITTHGFETEVPIKIDPGGTKQFAWEYRTWWKVEEVQEMHPQRVVERFSMDIVSRCQRGPDPKIDMQSLGRGEVTLLLNQRVSLPNVLGVTPGEKIFIIKALDPRQGP